MQLLSCCMAQRVHTLTLFREWDRLSQSQLQTKKVPKIFVFLSKLKLICNPSYKLKTMWSLDSNLCLSLLYLRPAWLWIPTLVRLLSRLKSWLSFVVKVIRQIKNHLAVHWSPFCADSLNSWSKKLGLIFPQLFQGWARSRKVLACLLWDIFKLVWLSWD